MNWGNKYLEKIKIIENSTINATKSWLKKKNGINCGIFYIKLNMAL